MKVHNLIVTGSLTSSGENISSISSSVATINNVQDGRLNSLETTSGSIISKTGSYATTGSNQFDGSQAITGSLTVTGDIIAQTLNVQQVTSSIVYSSGSNIFGNELSNTHQFTGSLQVSGSSHYVLGSVGVGVTNPAAELQVGKSSDVTIAMSNSSSVTSGNRGSLAWYNSSVSSVATIRATAVTDNVGTQLEFYTRPAAGNLTQAMTLTSVGNLGLGVTPSAWETTWKVIQLAGGSIYVNAGGTTGQIGLSQNWFYDGSQNRYLNSAAASDYYQFGGEHRWLTAPSGQSGDPISFTQAMTLTAGGNVGIGTTTVTAKTQISSTSAGAATVAAFLLNESTSLNTEVRLAFAANTNNEISSNRYSYISALNTSASNGQALIFATNEAGNSAVERMRITSGGNMGIGATDPDQILTIGAGDGISIRTRGSGTYGSLRFGTNNASFFDAWAGIDSDWEGEGINVSNLRFYTSFGDRAERMRITSRGQVNIGGNYTSTSNTLQVAGNVAIGTTTAAPTNGLLVQGNVLVNGSVTSTQYNTVTGSIVVPSGTYTTAYTFNNTDNILGVFSVRFQFTNASTVCLFTKTWDGGTTRLTVGSKVSRDNSDVISVNENAIQVYHVTGVSLTAFWSFVRIL
jgi:hypothetical protein